MNKTSLHALLFPALALVAAPGFAQDRFQVGLGFNRVAEAEQSYFNATEAYRFDRASKWVPSLFAGYQVLDFDGSNLSVTGEYQFQQRFGNTLLTSGTNNLGNVGGTTKSRYIAPGVQWNYSRHVDLGVGLQYRFTRLNGSLADQNITANNNRFWFIGYVGKTFDIDAPVKPFIALRGALALSKTKAPDFDYTTANVGTYKTLMKRLDSNHEISLQGGVRF